MQPIVSSQKTESERRIELLSRDLRKTIARLNEVESVGTDLRSVLTQLQNLLEGVQKDSVQKAAVAKELQDFEILALFSQLQSGLESAKKTALDFDESLLKTGVELSQLRLYRHYWIENAANTVVFLQQLASLYSIPRFEFKPGFVGVVDFAPLLTQLGAVQKERGMFSVEPQRLPELFDFLNQRRFIQQFRLDSPIVKLFFRNFREFKAETDNAIIKRIDVLVHSVGGTVLEK